MTRPRLLAALLVCAALVAGGLSLFASEAPDGLERVAEDHGFADRASALAPAPLPEYHIPALGEGPASSALAGLLGCGLVLALAWGLGSLLRRVGRGAAAAATRPEDPWAAG